MAELLVVATPIGNLADFSPRAREALERADLICAEDTRVTLKLLNHFSLKKPLLSYHRHNEEARAEPVIARMLGEDLTVALVSDAALRPFPIPASSWWTRLGARASLSRPFAARARR